MIQKETHGATPGLSLTLKPKCAVSPEPQPPRLATQQKSHEAQVRQHDTSSPEVSKSAALAVTRHDTRQADQILSLCHLGLKSQSLRITPPEETGQAAPCSSVRLVFPRFYKLSKAGQRFTFGFCIN